MPVPRKSSFVKLLEYFIVAKLLFGPVDVRSPLEVIRTLSSLFVPRVKTLEAGECIVVPVPKLKVSADNLSVSAIWYPLPEATFKFSLDFNDGLLPPLCSYKKVLSGPI